MADVVSSKQLSDDFYKRTKEQHKDPEAYRGFSFPSPWFMKFVGGFGRDWYTSIYGKAGIGKSSFLNTAVMEFGNKDIPFLYVSNEESLHTLAQKAVALLGDVDRTKFRDIRLLPTDWSDVDRARQRLAGFQGYWAYGLFEWSDLVKVIQRMNPLPQVILIDYLQLMTAKGLTKMVEIVARNSKNFQKLSKGEIIKNPDKSGHPISVISAAQLNDSNECLHSRDPDRDSDLIIEVATIDNGANGIIPDQRKLIVRKAKYGSVGSTTMKFFGKRALLGDIKTANPSTGPMTLPNLDAGI